MRIRHGLVLLAVGFLAAGSSPADDAKVGKRPMTVEDLWSLERVGRPAISPDGKWVAVEVTKYCMESNDSTSDIWLLSTDGKVQQQLTTFKGKNSEPTWSPDGKQIAFVSKRGDSPQLFLIAPEGGEARQLTKMPMAPSGLKWAPDGKALYCIARTWPDTPDDDSHKKKEKAQKDSKIQAHVIDDALFRVWDNWIADGRRPVVFAVDTATGKHKNLFAHTKLFLPIFQPSATDYDISPDGKEIAFGAETTKQIGTDFNSDIYLMPIDKPVEPKNLTADNLANDGSPAFSPDGKSIAFLRQTVKFFYADRARIMLLDRTSGKPRELTEKFDRTCGPPQWSGKTKGTLFFEAENKGYVQLYALRIDDSIPKPLTEGSTDRSLASSKDDSTGVFLRSSFNHPAQVWVTRGVGNLTRIDKFNDAITPPWKLGEVKEVYFKGADNEDVQMWVVHPPDFDPKKKWPLLQVVHGGPHNGITTDFSYRWNLHMFASKGYVVSCINFHGSSGFGQAFTDSITGDMGTKPMIDVIKGTDYMEALPYIDKNRTTAAGGSYGGFMMAWLNGHTDRYKAMICHAGVYNWHSMMASDFVRSRERPLGALPWGDQTKVDKQNPQRFAANFKTPTLVIHGEKDYRVPVTQGFEYYSTLRLKGVPTRLVYFPDENHWVLKPQNSRLWHQEFFGWLEKHVGSGPTK